MTRPIIALDVDDVQLNYKLAYAKRWEAAFGYYPKIKDPTAKLPWLFWDVPIMSEAEKAHFETFSDEHFWTTMPVLDGVVSACNLLNDAGFKLISVTAAPERTQAWRLRNLHDHGLNIEELYCTPRTEGWVISPKAEIINKLKPVYFVDDFVGFLYGIGPDTKKVLIDYPKNDPHPHLPHSELHMVADDLLEFAVNVTINRDGY